jgi:hypothetical protein
MSLPAGWFGKSFAWVKLSNSGDLLKLLVPSNIRKDIGGWTNYSGMVKVRRWLKKKWTIADLSQIALYL